MKINLDNRVSMCPECLCEKLQCVCGSDRPAIMMSRRMFDIFQAMEDHNVPVETIDFGSFIDTELIKIAGVA